MKLFKTLLANIMKEVEKFLSSKIKLEQQQTYDTIKLDFKEKNIYLKWVWTKLTVIVEQPKHIFFYLNDMETILKYFHPQKLTIKKILKKTEG